MILHLDWQRQSTPLWVSRSAGCSISASLLNTILILWGEEWHKFGENEFYLSFFFARCYHKTREHRKFFSLLCWWWNVLGFTATQLILFNKKMKKNKKLWYHELKGKEWRKNKLVIWILEGKKMLLVRYNLVLGWHQISSWRSENKVQAFNWGAVCVIMMSWSSSASLRY